MERPALAGKLAAEREAVERALEVVAADIGGSDAVSAPIRYALGVSGKRLRPILCVEAFRAVGGIAGREDDLYRAAASIELIHTYSLVHDDLPCMDDDDLRRGRPTVHRVYGSAAAAAAGFALIPLACRLLEEAADRLGLDATGRRAAVLELCHGAGPAGMVGGQVLDLEAEARHVPLVWLRRMHELKTGALFCASLRIGATLAAAPPDAVVALGEFGRRIGLAFQITDDVLDVTMDAGALGKTPNKDQAAEKPTFASLLGVAAARATATTEARAATRVLHGAGIDSPFLEALARFAVERDR